MNSFWILFTATLILVAIAIILLSVRVLIKKNGTFKKHCAFSNPKTGDKICRCDSTKPCKNH